MDHLSAVFKPHTLLSHETRDRKKQRRVNPYPHSIAIIHAQFNNDHLPHVQYLQSVIYNRLVKVVMLEALEMGSKVIVENLKQSAEEIRWVGVGVEELGRLSNGEVAQKLRNSI